MANSVQDYLAKKRAADRGVVEPVPPVPPVATGQANPLGAAPKPLGPPPARPPAAARLPVATQPARRPAAVAPQRAPGLVAAQGQQMRRPAPPPAGTADDMRARINAGMAQAAANPRPPTPGDIARQQGRQRAPTPQEAAAMAASGTPYVPRSAPVANPIQIGRPLGGTTGSGLPPPNLPAPSSQMTAASVGQQAPARLGPPPAPRMAAAPVAGQPRQFGAMPTPMGSAPALNVAFHRPTTDPTSGATKSRKGTPQPIPDANGDGTVDLREAQDLQRWRMANSSGGGAFQDVAGVGGDIAEGLYDAGEAVVEGIADFLSPDAAPPAAPIPTHPGSPGYVPQQFDPTGKQKPQGFDERKAQYEKEPWRTETLTEADKEYLRAQQAHAAANPPAYFPGTDYSTTAPAGGLLTRDPYRYFLGHDPNYADETRGRVEGETERGATNLETIGNEARSAAWGYANTLDQAAAGITARGDAGDTRLTNRANTIADTGTRVAGNIQGAAAAGQTKLDQFGQYLENYGSDAVRNVNDAAGGLTSTGERLGAIGDAERKRRLTELNPELAEGATESALDLARTLPELEATEGPSAAQAQLNLATDRNMRQQLALARSGRGFGQSASAMSEAADNVAQLQQEAANQSAILRAQENAAWRTRQASNIGTASGLGLTGAERFLSQEGARAQTEIESTRARDAAAANLYNTGVAALGQGADTTVDAGRLGLDVLTEEGRLRESGANMVNQAAMASAEAEQRAAEQAAATEARAIDTGVGAAVAGAGVTGQAAQTILQGLRDQEGAFNQANITRLSGEQLQLAITQAQQTGDLALEDMLTREYAIRAGQLEAANAAKAQRDASLIGAGGSLLTSVFTGWGGGGSDEKTSSDERNKKNMRPPGGKKGRIMAPLDYVTSDDRAKVAAAPDVQAWIDHGGKLPEGLEPLIWRAQKDGEEIAAGAITEWLNEGGRPPPGLVRHQGDYAENRLGRRDEPRTYERQLMELHGKRQRAPGTVPPFGKLPKAPSEKAAPAGEKRLGPPPAPKGTPKPAALPARPRGVPETDLRGATNLLYEYKDPEAPGAAPGTQIGPTAQQLQRTAAAPLVKRMPDGLLGVDGKRAGLVALGAIGEEQRRRDAQEARLRALEAGARRYG